MSRVLVLLMLASRVLLMLASVPGLALGGTTPQGPPHETMIERPDWQSVRRAPGDAPHTLLFAVREKLSGLHEELMAVSDPDSSRYGQHLTFDEVGALTSDPDATRCVVDYLREIGAEIVSTSPHGEFVRATHTVRMWERELHTAFHEYHHAAVPTSRRPILRTPTYHVPEQLVTCVAFIGYTSQLPGSVRPRPLLHAPHLNKPGTVDPNLLQSFYNIDTFTASGNVSQSVFEAVGANYSPEDLAEWLEYYSFPDHPVARDIGGHNSSALCKTTRPADCIEANLDLQYLMGVSQGAPTTYWYEANETWPFMAWVEAVLSDPEPVTVHSLSYDEPEFHVPATLLSAFSVAAQKLGLMGTTILVSSGDDGVAGAEARGNASACAFRPYFPAACPYVTAVGATQGPENYEAEIPETSNAHPSGGITTGGGFSAFYDQPAWQRDAVGAYVASARMPNATAMPGAAGGVTGYNASAKRGYPDVALMGHMYQVMIGGTQFGVSGTSASTPVVAGMVNLLNTKRQRAGKSLLGFLNPLLYAHPDVFNDMVGGNDRCTAASGDGLPVCCPVGFDAVKGWDPLTGLGSMDFARAVEAFV